MEEKNEEQIKPSFKELFLDYKEQKTRPIKRFFNTIYVVFTLIAYFYYLVYAILHIVKNGLENPISILLLIAIIIYTLILGVCAIISSTIKTAKKRIKKSLRVFRIFKRSITIISSAVAVVTLITALQAETTSGWALFISITSLIFNFFKISFALMGIMFTAGTSALKFGVKRTVKRIRKELSTSDNKTIEQNKNTAPAVETDAVDNDSTKNN